ncbi:MAG TPA: hypothetical protein ENI22_02595 [Candidatus Pacearchaeota archaeon]|nr:hypothetical protein [Candidatus Pacearchaeota archaeon]
MPQAEVTKKSELENLLEKHTSGEKLTSYEYKRAHKLIGTPEYSAEICGFCRGPDKKLAIYDTGLCQEHATYALVRGK